MFDKNTIDMLGFEYFETNANYSYYFVNKKSLPPAFTWHPIHISSLPLVDAFRFSCGAKNGVSVYGSLELTEHPAANTITILIAKNDMN